MKELDASSDWVAYDERRHMVYWLSWRSSKKLGMHQNGPIRLKDWDTFLGASRGFTSQIYFDQVRFEGNALEYSFHTSAKDGARGALAHYGLIPDTKYIVTIDDTDQDFDISKMDHDTFLKTATLQKPPPGGK